MTNYVDCVEYEFFFRLPICTDDHWKSLKADCGDYLKDGRVREPTFDLPSKIDLFVQTLLNPYCNVFMANEPNFYAFNENQPLFGVAERIIQYELYFGKPMSPDLMATVMTNVKKKAKRTDLQKHEASLRVPDFAQLDADLFALRYGTGTQKTKRKERGTVLLDGLPSATTTTSPNFLETHAAQLRNQNCRNKHSQIGCIFGK
mmetsp:Transcript_2267/g.3256  ORF Transcript_2267/g.3256 Transcript_2267/m.3256 type:complete len:203 (+) Transcript_2267:193-801(+)